jgi:2-hydroxy-3-keto-5-methylthiopentenyl-1-phosphate phosphatase
MRQQQQAADNEQKFQTPSIATLNKFKYPQEIEELKEQFHSIARMNHVFKYMSANFNIKQADMIRCLNEIQIAEQMKELLRRLKEKNFDLIIISDSNTFVIETILKKTIFLSFLTMM